MNLRKLPPIFLIICLLLPLAPASNLVPEKLPCAGIELCEEQLDSRAAYALAYAITVENWIYAQAALYEGYAAYATSEVEEETHLVLENVWMLSDYLEQTQDYMEGPFLAYVQSLGDDPSEYVDAAGDYAAAHSQNLVGFVHHVSNFTSMLTPELQAWLFIYDESDGRIIPQMPPFTHSAYFTVPPPAPSLVDDLARPPPPPPAPPSLYVPGLPEPVPTPADYPVPEFEIYDFDAEREMAMRAAYESAALLGSQVDISATAVATTEWQAPPPSGCTRDNLLSNPNADFDHDGLSNRVEMELMAYFEGDDTMFNPCKRSSDDDPIPDGRDLTPGGKNLPLRIRIVVDAVKQHKEMDCCGKHVWGEPYILGDVQWGTASDSNQGGFNLKFPKLNVDDYVENEESFNLNVTPLQAGESGTLSLPADVRAWLNQPPQLHFQFVLADKDKCWDDVYPSSGRTGGGSCKDPPVVPHGASRAIRETLYSLVTGATDPVDGLLWWKQSLDFGGAATVDVRIHIDMDLCIVDLVSTVAPLIQSDGRLSSIITEAPLACGS